METFTQDDLIYHYQWSKYQPNDPRISGAPDSTVFNKHEGQETLYIINILADHLAWDVRGFGKKVEQLIHYQLPGGIVRQDETIQWIKDNWRNKVQI